MAVAMILGVWLVLARLWGDRFATIACLLLAALVVLVWVVFPWVALRRPTASPTGGGTTGLGS